MYVECQMILWKDVEMNGRVMLGRALTLVIIGSLSEIKKTTISASMLMKNKKRISDIQQANLTADYMRVNLVCSR